MYQTQALKILKTGANVFLTGEPGSGKTYVINQYVAYLRLHGIEPAITASTGIAATHIGGMTIHSWSGIGIKNKLSKLDLRNIAGNDYVEKRVRRAKVLIIDEISMLPPGTLEMIDAICRAVKNNSLPFGGMQVVLVGDFFQLPPVNQNTPSEMSSRFAYGAFAWVQAEFVICYITEQYRQDDMDLISVLSKIRSNSFDELSLDHIQKRQVDTLKIPALAPKLYSHNIDVDAVNDKMLAQIPKEVQFFPMISKGREALIRTMKKGCLSPESLYLKVGAAVMFTKNNMKEGFVNGTLGIVESFGKDSELPIVKIRNGRKIEVTPADWMVEENGVVKGRLTQIPLRLAWAITVHKSQGISLDEAVIDLSKVFEFGQGYVAISRVRRLTGIHILGWNKMAFQVDPEVLRKDQEFRADSISAEKIFSNFSEAEFKKLCEDFIIICEGQVDSVDVVSKGKKKKSSTHNETLKLWKEGKTISQIAQIRNLSAKTILGHIEDLVLRDKIGRTDLLRAISMNLSRDLPKIHAVFKDLNTDRLTPVFEHFRGAYSYDELRFARMMIE